MEAEFVDHLWRNRKYVQKPPDKSETAVPVISTKQWKHNMWHLPFDPKCEICNISKIQVKTHKERGKSFGECTPFEEMSGDFVGPCNLTGLSGYKYVLNLVCRGSRFVLSFPLSSKGEGQSTIRSFKQRVFEETGIFPDKILFQRFHSDNALEFNMKDLPNIQDVV